MVHNYLARGDYVISLILHSIHFKVIVKSSVKDTRKTTNYKSGIRPLILTNLCFNMDVELIVENKTKVSCNVSPAELPVMRTVLPSSLVSKMHRPDILL